MPHLGRKTKSVLGIVAVLGVCLGFLSGPGSADHAPQTSVSAVQVAAPEATPRTSVPLSFPGLDPRLYRVDDGVALSDLPNETTAVLSLEPAFQAHMRGIYQRYEVPYGAFIALEPQTGRVLAYLSHSSASPDSTVDLVRDATPPTASVFKIVTGAALVDAGVDPDEAVCYFGGSSRLRLRNLDDDPARDRRCASLTEAMGGSINSVFAKLADRHLDPTSLGRAATAFGFGQTLPFDVSTRASAMEIPSERLEFARTSAGFWHMHMSPLHGALIAASIAARGQMPRPSLVDELIDAQGREAYHATHSPLRTVVSESTADAVRRMMEETVTHGTARQHFFDRRGRPFLPNIRVAGKTGTLSAREAYAGHTYTWFVGFAPAEAPQIALAALVINEPRWRIKASYVAREAMRYWLVQRPRDLLRAAREAESAVEIMTPDSPTASSTPAP